MVLGRATAEPLASLGKRHCQRRSSPDAPTTHLRRRRLRSSLRSRHPVAHTGQPSRRSGSRASRRRRDLWPAKRFARPATFAPVSEFSRHVQAAGGVVVRDGTVCVIHRPDYEDWSLPKGKLDADESHEQAALREVHEETGLRCRLGAELSPQQYTDRTGRPKAVRWWAMTVVADEGLTPSEEVDERRWIPVGDVQRLLNYEHDRALVREALAATG